VNIPQVPRVLLEGIALKERSEPLVLQKTFHENMYGIWHRSEISTTVADLQSDVLKLKGSYGEDLLKRPDSWLESQVENSNWSQLGVLKRAGIIVETADLRKLPTIFPCFADPDAPGEGFPFDYLQETQLYLGRPILISHFSKDGKWVFVESSVDGRGWIRASKFGFVSKRDIERVEKLPLATVAADDISIQDQDGHISDHLKLGTVLPLKRKSGPYAYLSIPILLDHQKIVFRECKVDSSQVLDQPLSWKRSNIQYALDQLIGKPYGWGNLLGNRDCSGMIRDFYTLFHILLPPSSMRIPDYGRVIDLSLKSREEKRAILEKEGIPFRTVLYKKGHVGIYIGQWKQMLLMFHSPWGVKTQSENQEGRNLIGKSVVSTLEYGKDLPYFNEQNGNFLKELTKIVLLE